MLTFEDLKEENEKLIYIGNDPQKYKEAIIGLTSDSNHLVYSYQKLVECFIKKDGMSEEDAIEWIEYNTIRSLPYCNKETVPIIIEEVTT